MLPTLIPRTRSVRPGVSSRHFQSSFDLTMQTPSTPASTPHPDQHSVKEDIRHVRRQIAHYLATTPLRSSCSPSSSSPVRFHVAPGLFQDSRSPLAERADWCAWTQATLQCRLLPWRVEVDQEPVFQAQSQGRPTRGTGPLQKKN